MSTPTGTGLTGNGRDITTSARRDFPTPGVRVNRTGPTLGSTTTTSRGFSKQGDAKTDVAVYMQNYLYPPSQVYKTRHWGDMKLAEAGYTRDYLNPDMLNLPAAKVTGNRLAASGPAYKALILDSEQGPPTDP